jgi:hypothetical protein
MGIENHTQVFFLGDLNFRINDLSRIQVMQKIEQKKIDELLKEDDYTKSIKQFNFNQRQTAETKFH